MDTNPFSTKLTRPGAIPFHFEQDDSVEKIVDRLAEHGWWGEIVGPHGSGKTTLLHTLEAELVRRQRTVEWFRVRPGERRLNLDAARTRHWTTHTQVLVDGYEQLNWWSRWSLRRRCRRSGAGLTVTAHRSVGLPTLFTMRPSEALAAHLVLGLLPESPTTITAVDIANSFHRHGGNVREVLFEMYDLYQSRQSS